MWPEREGLAEHAELRATLGTYDYVAQYDQEPIPAGGKLFDPDLAPIVDAWPPDVVAAVRWWDKAATAGGGDFSAGVLVGVDKARRYWILDVRRGQWSAAERNQVMRNVAKLDAAQAKRYRYDVVTWVEREGGSGGKESAENTVIDLAGYPVFAEGTTGDKTSYARALAAQWEVRNVSVLNRTWTSAYLDEMGAFSGDGSGHDDQVDASSRAFLKLAIRKDPGGYRPGRPRAVADDLTSHLNGYLS
jgi:predicted phage terminase large subunit-like protein